MKPGMAEAEQHYQEVQARIEALGSGEPAGAWRSSKKRSSATIS